MLQINIMVSDGEFSALTDFELEITPVNDPPTLEPISNQYILENQTSEIEFSVS